MIFLSIEKLGGLSLIIGSLLLALYSALFPILLPIGNGAYDFVKVVLNPSWEPLAIASFAGVILMMIGYYAAYSRIRSRAGLFADWHQIDSGKANMILEVAILNVIAGQEPEFEMAFQKASGIISSMTGYISHQLQRCIEAESRYLLLVNWETIEDHTQGFRGSDQYQAWRALPHHFYDPFPTVEHYTLVASGSVGEPSCQSEDRGRC